MTKSEFETFFKEKERVKPWEPIASDSLNKENSQIIDKRRLLEKMKFNIEKDWLTKNR